MHIRLIFLLCHTSIAIVTVVHILVVLTAIDCMRHATDLLHDYEHTHKKGKDERTPGPCDTPYYRARDTVLTTVARETLCGEGSIEEGRGSSLAMRSLRRASSVDTLATRVL